MDKYTMTEEAYKNGYIAGRLAAEKEIEWSAGIVNGHSVPVKCRFCKTFPEVMREDRKFNPAYYVVCTNPECKFHVLTKYFDTEEKAVYAWNEGHFDESSQV